MTTDESGQLSGSAGKNCQDNLIVPDTIQKPLRSRFFVRTCPRNFTEAHFSASSEQDAEQNDTDPRDKFREEFAANTQWRLPKLVDKSPMQRSPIVLPRDSGQRSIRKGPYSECFVGEDAWKL